MTTVPVLDLFYSPTRRVYLIQSYMRNPEFGYSVATGDFKEVREDEMESVGLSLILTDLDDYKLRTSYVPSALERMGPRFFKDHTAVCVSLEPEHQLTIEPIRFRGDGSGHGDASRRRSLALPTTSDKLMAALRQAIE